jgi:hypothetical protein
MDRKRRVVPVFLDELDCFGDYAKTNPLCTKYCVLRLRCAIAQEQNIRMEVLSDLANFEGMVVKIQ